MSLEITISYEFVGAVGLGIGIGFSIGMYIQKQKHASETRDKKVEDMQKQIDSIYSILAKMDHEKIGELLKEGLSKEPELLDKILKYYKEKEDE